MISVDKIIATWCVSDPSKPTVRDLRMDAQSQKTEVATELAFAHLRDAMVHHDQEAVTSISYRLLNAGHKFDTILEEAVSAVNALQNKTNDGVRSGVTKRRQFRYATLVISGVFVMFSTATTDISSRTQVTREKKVVLTNEAQMGSEMPNWLQSNVRDTTHAIDEEIAISRAFIITADQGLSNAGQNNASYQHPSLRETALTDPSVHPPLSGDASRSAPNVMQAQKSSSKMAAGESSAQQPSLQQTAQTDPPAQPPLSGDASRSAPNVVQAQKSGSKMAAGESSAQQPSSLQTAQKDPPAHPPLSGDASRSAPNVVQAQKSGPKMAAGESSAQQPSLQETAQTDPPVHPPLSGDASRSAPNVVQAQKSTAKMVAGESSAADLQSYISRADQLVATGDVAGARVFYQRAAEYGSAIAAKRLGATYDPKMLAQAGLPVLLANEDAARLWYKLAQGLRDNNH